MTLLDKLKPGFLGIDMKRDEYLRQEGNKIMAVGHIYSFFLLGLLMLVSLIWDLLHNTISLATILLFVILQIISIYFIIQSKKINVLSSEAYSPQEYKERLKSYKLQTLKGSLLWGSWMYVWINIINPMIIGDTFHFDWKSLIVLAVGTIFFGITIYWVMKSRLKKEYEE